MFDPGKYLILKIIHNKRSKLNLTSKIKIGIQRMTIKPWQEYGEMDKRSNVL